MITIDGSEGEGGGQILRTALGLSLVTGKPFRAERIRAGRERPGLMRQHLASVNAAASVGDAQVEGAAIGSTALTFAPRTVRAGEHRFVVGSAGSTTLVLQTVLAALLCADGPSTVTIEGGTHNPWAPPFDFVDRAFRPLVNRLGPTLELTMERAGFYPAGGGRIIARVTPRPRAQWTPFDLAECGERVGQTATAVVAGLPGEIAVRELARIRQHLAWPEGDCQIRQWPAEWGPGNAVMCDVASANVAEVFTAFGLRGVTGDAVATAAATQVQAYLASRAPVGPYLADQLLVPLALAGGGSFVTAAPTPHARTNAATIARFLDVAIDFRDEDQGRVRVVVDASVPSPAARHGRGS